MSLVGHSAKFFCQKSASSSSSSSSSLIRLPVLDMMIERAKTIDSLSLKDTAVVYVHHALGTSETLLNSMFQLGLSPKNTFVLGKRYSNSDAIIERIKGYGVHYQVNSKQAGLGEHDISFTRDINSLWADVVAHLKSEQANHIKKVLLLDHGGYAVKYVPHSILEGYKVVGLEKTTSGIIALGGRLPNLPVINVAKCAAKNFLESPLIAEAIMTKLAPFIDMAREPTECGIIGYGVIGRAIAEKLLKLGHRVMVYDNNLAQLQTLKSAPRKDLRPTNDLSTLVNFSKLVFGCSGSDVTESLDAFTLAPAEKTLISCSSEDREFLTLLNHIQQKYNGKARVWANDFKDVVYTNEFGHNINILRAGFPYNFDHSGESVPANDIQLTRALVLAGFLQSIDFLKKPHIFDNGNNMYALDAELQQWVVREWLKYQEKGRYSKETLANFEDLDWINKNSSGDHEPLSFSLDSPSTQTLKM